MKKMTLDHLEVSSFLTSRDTRRLKGGVMIMVDSEQITCKVSRIVEMCDEVSGGCQVA